MRPRTEHKAVSSGRLHSKFDRRLASGIEIPLNSHSKSGAANFAFLAVILPILAAILAQPTLSRCISLLLRQQERRAYRSFVVVWISGFLTKVLRSTVVVSVRGISFASRILTWVAAPRCSSV